MKRIAVYIVTVLTLFSSLLPQEQEDVVKRKVRYGFDIHRRPPVNYNIYVGYSGEKWHPELYLGIAIQNDVLQFQKEVDAFSASYQITMAVRTKENEQTILTETWSQNVVKTNFEDTNSRSEYQYSSFRVSGLYPEGDKQLNPGSYECILEVRDMISQKTYRNKRSFEVIVKPEDDSDFKAPQIVFLFDEQESPDMMQLAPTSSTLEFNRPYRALLGFPFGSRDSLQVNMRLFRKDREADNLIHQSYQTVSPDSENIRFEYRLPYQTMEEGMYKIRISGNSEDVRFSQEKEFRIVWFEKPTYLYKADLAVRPLQYLLEEEEYKKVKGKDYSELEEWLKDYWREKDPTAETAYNELLDVFYSRVDEANREYSTRFKEGWETDQGKILILYGPPQNIENKRYATNTMPYIIWYYEEGERTFTFVDADQDGEFTLKTTENGKE